MEPLRSTWTFWSGRHGARSQGVAGESWVDATTSHSGNGERDASIEFASTAAEPPARRRLGAEGRDGGRGGRRAGRRPRRRSCSSRDEPDPADVPPPTLPAPPPTTVPATTAVDPFVGVWLSTDTDGSSQTMEIARSGTDDYDVVIRDEAATAACAGGASTLTGAGLLATDTSLVIAQPELTLRRRDDTLDRTPAPGGARRLHARPRHCDR